MQLESQTKIDALQLLQHGAAACCATCVPGGWTPDAVEKVVAYFGTGKGSDDLDDWQRWIVATPQNCTDAVKAFSKSGRDGGSGSIDLRVPAYFFAKRSYQVRPLIFAESFAWSCVACLKATGETPSLASSAFRKTVAQDLSSIRLPPQCRNATKIAQIAAHYSVAILGDDANLAKHYERSRKIYLESPEDEKRIIEFGWVLRDCLNQSIKLKNVKLSRFFAKDFAALKLSVDGSADSTAGKASSVLTLIAERKRLLSLADEVISGLGQVKSFVQDRQWQSALTACDRCLEDNPRSKDGLLLRPKILGEMHDFQGALTGYWNYFQTFGRTPDALKEYAWFVARTFASFRPSDPEWRKLKIGSARVAAFLGDVLNRFDLIDGVEKTDKVYSALLNSVTRACSSLLTGRASRLASLYILFVKKWGLRNLSEADDREWMDSSHRRHPSLRMRVADTLVLAVLRLGKGDSLEAHPFICEFVAKSLARTGRVQPLKMKWRLPEFYRLSGDNTAARRSAVELVAAFPVYARAWIALGETYPAHSEEEMLCRCRARTLESKAERSKRELTERIFALLGSDDRGDDLVSSIVRRGVKKENVEAYIADRSEQAERLIGENGQEVDGLVLTGFLDKHDRRMRYRLWWPANRGLPEGQSFAVLEDLGIGVDRPAVGTPVSIQLVHIGGKLRPVRVRPRAASLWDGYPQVDGVVVSKDESRGFIRLLTRFGDDLWADLHQCPELAELDPGEGCRIGILKRQNDTRILFGRGCAESVGACSECVKTYSGTLGHRNGSPGGFVGDVTVPRNLIRGILLETVIKGTAVKVKANRRDKQASWLAVTVEKPKKGKAI